MIWHNNIICLTHVFHLVYATNPIATSDKFFGRRYLLPKIKHTGVYKNEHNRRVTRISNMKMNSLNSPFHVHIHQCSKSKNKQGSYLKNIY